MPLLTRLFNAFPFLFSEWVIGNREDLAKDIIAEIQTENGEVIKIYKFCFSMDYCYEVNSGSLKLLLDSLNEERKMMQRSVIQINLLFDPWSLLISHSCFFPLLFPLM